ncbi:MAG: NUDIX hydrolase [Acidimicrobiia bacterium]
MTAFEVVGEDVIDRGWNTSWTKVRVRGPDGEVHVRDVVRHPGAVAVVPLHEDGTVTLVRQYRAALDGDCLEVPAGMCDVDGESDEATARRELLEEAGLVATSVERLIVFHASPGMTDERVAVFLATGLSDVDHDRQGPEEQEMTVERHPLAEVEAMVRDGRITDAKTIIGLALCRGR